jgi:hypothetical protein
MTPLGLIKLEIPTFVPEPPSGDGWIHEIKHDGLPPPAGQERDSGDTDGVRLPISMSSISTYQLKKFCLSTSPPPMLK